MLYNKGTKREREENKMTTIITSYLFWQFVILNFINVLINTARSLTTVKGGKWIASLMNALCYGYYTVIIVITATYDIPLPLKIVAVAIVNFIGVFTIKFCEEKIQKEKLWIYNVIGVDNVAGTVLGIALKNENIKFTITEVAKHFNNIEIFSETMEQSETITKFLDNLELKYYAVEAMEKNRN